MPKKAQKTQLVFSRSGVDLSESLTTKFPAIFSATHISEPQLSFCGNLQVPDPKTGLALYGPWSLNTAGAPSQIRVGIIGSGETIGLAEKFLEDCRGIVRPDQVDGKIVDPLLFPSFPGFSSSSPFKCDLVVMPNLQETISPKELSEIISASSYIDQVTSAVQLISKKLSVLKDKETPPDVVLCVLPSEIEEHCRLIRGSTTTPRLTAIQKKIVRRVRSDEKSGQMALFDILGMVGIEETDPGHQNLHRALKAHAMGIGLKTQLIWHSTLSRSRPVQDRATLAWNLCAALYYKAGGIPWKTTGLKSGTCFIGISFYSDRSGHDTQMRTSMAQVFSDEGEGIVLRGEPFKWDIKTDRTPHLAHDAAKSLLQQALTLYRAHWKREPNRVVIHKSSRYWADELKGFEDGLGDIQFYDFLTLEHAAKRFLRLGYEPPVRGTMIQLAPKHYLLYTRGYVPFLRTYPGHRIPSPLEILEHHGTTSSSQIGTELLALSKLNWNTADFSCGDPITIAFAREIGLILAELPKSISPQASYRYYM